MKVIEWVHMLRILGAHKVHIQVTKVHPDLVEVLNHLQARDLIEWIYYFDPSGIVAPENPLIQYRMLQMSVINDCYSKVQSLYEYVAILDYDEVIMPVVEEDKSWEQILNRLDHLLLKKDLISFEHVFYPNQNIKPYEDIPNHNYMLQHVQRSVKNFNSTRGVKSFFRSDRVLVVHNHFGLKCLKRKDGWCEVLYVSKNISQLNHYRNEVEYSYNVTELDSTIWKFKDELIKAVEETLNEINFKP